MILTIERCLRPLRCQEVENSASWGVENVEDLSDIVTDNELVSASQLFELSESEFVMSTEQL